MWAWQFSKLQYTAELHGWTRFISMQDQYNLVAREEEREMFPLLADQGAGSLPWSPLAAGLLARPWGDRGTTRGKTNPSADSAGTPLFLDSDKGTVDAVQRIAEARGIPMATVALAWMLRNPVVSAPIIGATSPRHLTDAVAALDLTLTDDEISALEQHYTPRQPTYYGTKTGY
jgi:aryl-alcohol dehydrogenase-like predicted oxidoreductase